MPIVTTDEKGNLLLEEIDLDSWKSTFRRVLVNGPPLSGKTTSLKTFPAKRHILVAPGELGHSSIQEDADTRLYYWEFDPSSTSIQYKRIWQQVRSVTSDVLSGKHGQVDTFAIDGLHKLYYVVMKSLGYTIDSDPREFGRYHEEFGNYMNQVLGSNTPSVVATCYDGLEAIEAGSKIMQIFPLLPGKMAKDIMGSFPIVFHSERSGEGAAEKYIWRMRATGKIQACGMHLPPEVRKLFPAEIEQDWRKVEEIVGK